MYAYFLCFFYSACVYNIIHNYCIFEYIHSVVMQASHACTAVSNACKRQHAATITCLHTLLVYNMHNSISITFH